MKTQAERLFLFYLPQDIKQNMYMTAVCKVIQTRMSLLMLKLTFRLSLQLTLISQTFFSILLPIMASL